MAPAYFKIRHIFSHMRQRVRTLLLLTHLIVLLIGFSMAHIDLDERQHLSGTRHASWNLVAVSATGQGSIGTVTVEITEGNGRTLVNTDPFLETDIQSSARTARRVAAQATGTAIEDKNIIYSFQTNGRSLGGPSAGASMAVVTMAAIENRSLDDETLITGTVRPDGKIGRVGGVTEKAFAAGRQGIKTFLVPAGQEEHTFYEAIETDADGPGLIHGDVQYQPHRIDLNEVTAERFGMQTLPIRTVTEAYQQAVE